MTPLRVCSNDAVDLEGQFHSVLAALLSATGAMRTTVRIDIPSIGWSVNRPCAEVLAPGARSMRADEAIDHRRAQTIRWIDRNRVTLVQPDLRSAGKTAPPSELITLFGAGSQIVAPLFGADQYLVGWVSAHFSEVKKNFSEPDKVAVESARDTIGSLLGKQPHLSDPE